MTIMYEQDLSYKTLHALYFHQQLKLKTKYYVVPTLHLHFDVSVLYYHRKVVEVKDKTENKTTDNTMQNNELYK